MTGSYTLNDYIAGLQRITNETTDEEEIIERVSPLAQRLALEKNWIEKHHYDVDREQGFLAHLLHEEPDHTLAIFAVSWLPHRGAPPHDHGTWVIVAGVDGIERNVRYKRVDDRSRSNYAELEIKNTLDANEGELVCMKTGGIHSVHNDSEQVTLSLHTYGVHVNYTTRSQYDLETNEKKDFKVRVQQ